MDERLTLEVVEGPDAGTRSELRGVTVVGRSPDVDLILHDGEVSRRHARVIAAADGSVTVEDLGSANGTFLNDNELLGPARLHPGDQLLIGVTVLQLRTAADVRRQTSAAVAIPPALAVAPRPPTYVNPEVARAEGIPSRERSGIPELDKFLDVRVRRRAQLAPLALFVLIALALILYFGLR